MRLEGHESLSAIQDLYPNPPVLRYHRIAPKIEQGLGQIPAFLEKSKPPNLPYQGDINWLDVAIAFLLGYFVGGRKNERS